MPYIEMTFHEEVAIIFTSTTLPIKVNIIINTLLFFFLISLFFTKGKLVEVRANPDVILTDN